MNKILISIVATMAMATTSFADITEKQLNLYMKASGGDAALTTIKTQLGGSLQQRAAMEGKTIPPKVFEAINAVATKDENLKKFTAGLIKLDEKEYSDIMKFYETDLGKKVAETARNMDMATMQKEMMEFSKKEMSSERKVIISQLATSLMSEEQQIKISKSMALSMISSMPKEMQEMMKSQIEKQIEASRPILKQQVELSTGYTYKDFSDKELNALTARTKTIAGRAEIEAMTNGMVSYMGTVMPEMIAELTKMGKESK